MPPLILGVGSLGLMVLVTSWIAHRIGGRIRRVQQQVARIADGDFRELDPSAASATRSRTCPGRSTACASS